MRGVCKTEGSLPGHPRATLCPQPNSSAVNDDFQGPPQLCFLGER